MSLFRNRNFVILFSGQMVSTVGDNLYGIAILWYVLALTHSKADLAITGFGMTWDCSSDQSLEASLADGWQSISPIDGLCP